MFTLGFITKVMSVVPRTCSSFSLINLVKGEQSANTFDGSPISLSCLIHLWQWSPNCWVLSPRGAWRNILGRRSGVRPGQPQWGPGRECCLAPGTQPSCGSSPSLGPVPLPMSLEATALLLTVAPGSGGWTGIRGTRCEKTDL